MRIEGRIHLKHVSSSSEDHLPYQEWKQFEALGAGEAIRIGNRKSKKLGQKVIERKTNHDTFHAKGWL